MLGKRLLLLLIGVFCVACSSCYKGSVGDFPKTTSDVAVAKLIIIDSDGDRDGTCTVWKVAEGLLATAGHCCEKDKHYMIDGLRGVPGHDIRVLVDDDKRDICILNGRMIGRPIRLAKQDPAIGERVWVSGFPRGYFMMTDGYWSGRDETDDELAATYSIEGIPGYSGSPVMNTNSEVVSILTHGYLGSGVTFGPNLDYIRNAIRKARLVKIKIDDDDVIGELPREED